MLESNIQAKGARELRKAGWIVDKSVGHSHNGWPDMQCYRDGITIFIEWKKPGKKPDPLQWYWIKKLRKAGFQAYVIDDWNDLKKHKLI